MKERHNCKYCGNITKDSLLFLPRETPHYVGPVNSQRGFFFLLRISHPEVHKCLQKTKELKIDRTPVRIKAAISLALSPQAIWEFQAI